MIRFKSLEDFLGSTAFISRDLEDIDLSNLDLSSLDENTWYLFRFDNVDFSNTNINLNPKLLKSGWYPATMVDCNFTNCDFSNWEDGYLDYVNISWCNFTNTKLHIKIATQFSDSYEYRDFSDVIFGSEYTDEEIREFLPCFSSKSLKNYPNLELSTEDAYVVVNRYFRVQERYSNVRSNCGLYNDYKYEDIVTDIAWLKEFDKCHGGVIENILNTLKSTCDMEFTENDEEFFYLGYVNSKSFGDVDLTIFPEEIVRHIKFVECRFKSLHVKSFIDTNKFYYPTFNNTVFDHITYDDITFDSWEDDLLYKRFADSHATVRIDAYVELGRRCNANCAFCRNDYMSCCEYDLSKIISTTIEFPQISNIVIGGGEPTLFFDDLKHYLASIPNDNEHVKIFSNASDYDKLVELGRLDGGYDLFISRHAASDHYNNQIFGIKTLGKNDLRSLNNNIRSHINLVCTCFKGLGVDSYQKMINYFKFAVAINARSILFQTLHKDLNSENVLDPISDQLFDKMIKFLRQNGFEISQEIYSTGNYKLIIAKNKSRKFDFLKVVSFKKYISEEELKKEWFKAAKRTFDLSIAPNGDLYHNWHQSSGKVLRLEGSELK